MLHQPSLGLRARRDGRDLYQPSLGLRVRRDGRDLEVALALVALRVRRDGRGHKGRRVVSVVLVPRVRQVPRLRRHLIRSIRMRLHRMQV